MAAGEQAAAVEAATGPHPRTPEAQRALQAAAEAFERNDVEATVTHLSAAVRALTAEGAVHLTAMTCLQLGDVLALAMGNLVAGRAWYARANRLLEGVAPCVEQGWAAIAGMGCDWGDPDGLVARAELALERARQFGDVNLEAKALADGGLAHVQAGRVAQGMAQLDEAMALVCGPADDVTMRSRSACSFFTACYYSADYGRAASWADLMRRQGLIGLSHAPAIWLSNHCDSVQATLLIELGRWSEAEELLTRAMVDFERVLHAPSWHPAIVLADLRIRQGRHADAEALLVGKDQAFEALVPAARLHLARGDADLAVATAQRGLRALGRDRHRAVELLTVVAEAEVARGDLDAAARAVADLGQRVAEVGVPALAARAVAATARVMAANGQETMAVATLEVAVDALDAAQLPWLRATLLLDLARQREAVGDAAGAALDAAAANAALDQLDVVLSPDEANVIDRLARRPSSGAAGHARPATAVGPDTASLALEGKWWTATAGGTTVRLPDTKGLRYLAALVASPGAEHHALDLVDRVEGVQPGLDRRLLGDAGPVLDAKARQAYRTRIEELREACDDALAAGELERAEALDAELQQLVRQLAQAFGLGGRDRKAASAAERARLNVTRALRAALAKLTDALPVAGAALDRRVRTGLYCCYTPDPADPIRWIVQPALNGPRRD